MRKYKNAFEKIICEMTERELLKLRDFCSRKQVINKPSIDAVNMELKARNEKVHSIN